MTKFWKNKHFIITCVLFLIAGILEFIVRLNFDSLLQNPIRITRFLNICPIYNKNGSWFFGRIGIGYIRWLLLLVDITLFFIIIFLMRYIDVMEQFFKIKSVIKYALDFGFAAALYRFFAGLRNAYILDYFDIGRFVYDIVDFYIFVCSIGIIIWLLWAMKPYYSFRRQKVRGMNSWEKFKWEIKLSLTFLKTTFLPKDKWEQVFCEWGQ